MVGIHAPTSEISELKKVYDIFQEYNVLYRFYILVTSSRLIVGRATSILKRDIDKLPFPANLSELKVSDLEKRIIKEVLDCYANKGIKPQFRNPVKYFRALQPDLIRYVDFSSSNWYLPCRASLSA